MTRPRLDTLDEYEHHLSDTLARWPSARRTAFAAAMAERWLAVYRGFAAKESWGDPDALAHALDAAWAHAGGRPLGEGNRARHLGLVRDATPHMDDFDAPEALAAAVMVQEAVTSCAPDNHGAAVQAALSGFEAVNPEWSLDPDEQPRLWRRGPIRKELERQLAIIERLTALDLADPQAVGRLRAELCRAPLAGTLPARKETAAPALRTNQEIFEQYRGIVELDLRGRRDVEVPGAGPGTMAMLRYAEWMGRYHRRLALLSGGYGPLADQTGMAALVRRQQARDRAVRGAPAWDEEVREMVGMVMRNPTMRLDVRDAGDPHGYGPSVRRLWVEAKDAGASDEEAWRQVVAWARHRPAAWAAEDARKRGGKAIADPKLAERLARAVEWRDTGDPERPWEAEVEGERWTVRLNDFPEEPLYTLLVDGAPAGDFHDWPERWRRP